MTRATAQNGFALVLMVSLLAFVVLLLVSLAALTRVEIQVADHAEQGARARRDVWLGVQVALGQLQRYAGPDDRVTATAEAWAADGTRHYTGVWESGSDGSTPLIWLVSGNEQEPLGVDPGSPTEGFVELVGAATATGHRQVVAPWIDVVTPPQSEPAAPAQTSRIAWWVEDLGVKASLTRPDRSREVAYGPWLETASRLRLRQQVGSTPTWIETAVELSAGFDPWTPANRDVVERALQPRQLAWLATDETEPLASAVHARWAEVGTVAHAVLANTLPHDQPERGLLQDLSLDAALLGPAFAAYASFDYIETPGVANDAIPAITTPASPRRRASLRAPVTQPATPQQPPFLSTVAPVLTELLLQFRLDRVVGGVELRSRLYAGLWNPYTTALRPPDELALVIRGLPTITIRDPVAGATADVDLQAAPFGAAGSRVSLPFVAGAQPQTDRSSWLPGRVYSWVTATGSDPPAELLFYNKTLNASGWVIGVVPLGGTSSNLGVTAPLVSELVVELHAGDQLLATYRLPEYPAVSVPDVEPPGAGAYWNWRLAYGARLNQPSSTSLDRSWLLSPGRDPRDPEPDSTAWDPFNASAGFEPDAAAYAGTPATATGMEHHLLYRVQGSGLTTRSANYDAPVFELPRQPLLSLGELQHVPMAGSRPFAVGNSWGGTYNSIYDRFFFTGLAPSGPGPDLAAGDPLPNYNLVPVQTSAPLDLDQLRAGGRYASALLLQRGAFNVNSTSAVAWAALLANVRFPTGLGFTSAAIDNGPMITASTGSQRDETAVDTEHFLNFAWGSSERAGPAFFRFPQTAQETYYSSAVPVLGPTELNRRPFRRGVRGGEGDHENSLTAGQIQALAARIGELVQWKHAYSGPFRTLQEFLNTLPEFANQSLLERAIAETGLNRDNVQPRPMVAAPEHVGFSSATLTQADILTALAPYLRVRSDTFAIRVRAETLNPVTGAVAAQAVGEAVVQRFPQPVMIGDSVEQPAGRFGRRFELISFRWLSPAEL